jgi:hypothetical protein
MSQQQQTIFTKIEGWLAREVLIGELKSILRLPRRAVTERKQTKIWTGLARKDRVAWILAGLGRLDRSGPDPDSDPDLD